jgi:hypothetical protein
LDFSNATKADLDRNMASSASVGSFLHHTVSHISFLGGLAPPVSMMRTALSDAFSTDTIKFEETKASQLDGGGSFKQSLCASDR